MFAGGSVQAQEGLGGLDLLAGAVGVPVLALLPKHIWAGIDKRPDCERAASLSLACSHDCATESNQLACTPIRRILSQSPSAQSEQPRSS